MGRKKRSAPDAVGGGGTVAPPPLPPPPLPPTAYAMTLDPYGRPVMPPPPPPPMIPPPELHQQQQHHMQQNYGMNPSAKRTRTDADDNNDAAADSSGERQSYPVKKYRPDSYYRSIEAFTRYTKAHRMLDAAYVKWTGGGGSFDKPIVFGIRIAGSYLSWGRGKTRDAAIDAAIRAAFALVAAHGYDDFTLNEDCFTEEPFDAPMLAPMPPPPPPPPPPPYMIPPPLPPGMPPNFMLPPVLPPSSYAMPPPPSINADDLIPQPLAPSADLAVASTVVLDGNTTSTASKLVGLTTASSQSTKPLSSIIGGNATVKEDTTNKKSGGGGSNLVFSGDEVDEQGEELSMEEIRIKVPRYWNMVLRALTSQKQ